MLKVAIIAALLAIGAGMFVALNPLVFGFDTGIAHDKFFVFDKHFMLDGELESVRPDIPNDEEFQRYRNHCLRVMTFAKYLIPDFVYDEYPSAINIIAMAVAYHRVGLWTDGELNYLEASVKQMEFHIRKEGLFEETHIDIARQIIMEQHKLTHYAGNGTSKAIDAIINVVRKADWADATMGIIRYNLPAPLLEATYAKLDSSGFHQMLLNFGPRLSPNSLIGRLSILKIFKF